MFGLHKLKKIYGYINDYKIPGVIIDGISVFYYKGFWFRFIPDRVEDRNIPLEIDRRYLLDHFKIKERDG
jgi:hypothetical protein